MMKRFSQMNQFMQKGMGGLPKKLTCVLNSSSALLKTIINLNKSGKSEAVSTACQHVVDLAVLSNQPLEGAQLDAFLKRSFSLLEDQLSD